MSDEENLDASFELLLLDSYGEVDVGNGNNSDYSNTCLLVDENSQILTVKRSFLH